VLPAYMALAFSSVLTNSRPRVHATTNPGTHSCIRSICLRQLIYKCAACIHPCYNESWHSLMHTFNLLATTDLQMCCLHTWPRLFHRFLPIVGLESMLRFIPIVGLESMLQRILALTHAYVESACDIVRLFGDSAVRLFGGSADRRKPKV
jgi:hypothetical protein